MPWGDAVSFFQSCVRAWGMCCMSVFCPERYFSRIVCLCVDNCTTFAGTMEEQDIKLCTLNMWHLSAT